MWVPSQGMTDTDTLLIAVGLLGTVAALMYRAYLKHKPAIDQILEDGVDLSDVADIVELAKDAKEDIAEIKEAIDEVPSWNELKRMKKAELMDLADKHGLPTEGTRAVLIDALTELRDAQV